MNDRITAGAAALVGAITFGSHFSRWWVTDRPTPGQHRAPVEMFVPLDDLLGPPSPWLEFEHAPGVIGQQFRDCPHCHQTAAGSLNKDGWLCGECFTPAGAEAVS